MARTSSRVGRGLVLLVAGILALALVPGAGAAIAAVAPPAGKVFKAQNVWTKSQDLANKRLDPRLRETAARGGEALVDVLVQVKAGAKAPAGLVKPLPLRLRADKASWFYAGKVKAKDLVRVATARNVSFVADNGRRTPPPIPDEKKTSRAAARAEQAKRIAALKEATDSGTVKKWADSLREGAAPKPPAGGQPTDWQDVGDTHRSAAAWANGFTGAGVRVGVADDSLDFANPDLQGTQARVTDPASPYLGWPMAFDPLSVLLYARDTYLGETNTASGASWWSDTSAEVTSISTTFDGTSYTLPGTSLSGTYHIGYQWDDNIALNWNGFVYDLVPEYSAVLVADENTPGVYDTVYVDLNYNQDFSDDKPCTKNDPISYLDAWDATYSGPPDGLADLSGGMIYWIADGTNQPPGYDEAFGYLPTPVAPADGTLVCFMGAFDADSAGGTYDHGTLCGSAVAAQGRIDSYSIDGEYPSFKPAGTGTSGGIVQGGGKDASLVGISDIYMNYYTSTLMAYDFVSFGLDGMDSSGDEVQILSNSYGESDVDNDEWDYPSRYITLLNTAGFAPNTAFLFSTGNGGPGYGTNAPPSPTTGIGVGASTQFGADGGWDSIASADQITRGDVIPFSNRGPSAMGHTGPAVVADGAYASGNTALNRWAGNSGNGAHAWEIWGGTSRSCPIAAGNLALVYDAFEQNEGRWPTYEEARTLLMSGATDLNNDTLVQGSGAVNAERSTDIAAGLDGLMISPGSWSPGDFRGATYPAYQQVMHPGDADVVDLTVANRATSAKDVTVADAWYQKLPTVRTYSVTLNAAGMSAYSFNRPDWLRRIDADIPADAELMVVKAVLPLNQLDPDADYTAENRVRLVTYDWTDIDTDGTLWHDANANGVVNTGELDVNEYMRFSYANQNGPALENRVQMPLNRMHDGVYLGLQYQTRSTPVTVQIEVTFWSRTDWAWASQGLSGFQLAAGASRSVPVMLAVPADAPVGTYEGQVMVGDGTNDTVVPIIVSVAADGTDFAYGGPSPYTTLLDNGSVAGGTDWAWRAESGDWRFFYTDVPDGTAQSGSKLLAHTWWDHTPTDIDTLVYGPAPSQVAWPEVFGPNDLSFKGGSPNANVGAGIWFFDTATGGAEDWVSADLSDGLNALMLHNVLYDGTSFSEPFQGEAGRLDAEPSAISITSDVDDQSVDTTFTATLGLPGFGVTGYGLAKPFREFDIPITTGATWRKDFVVSQGASFDAFTSAPFDIDLYVYYNNGGGWMLVGASESGGGDEAVRITLPLDGTYRVAVYGYSVSAPGVFSTEIHMPMGSDMNVAPPISTPIAPGAAVNLPVSFSKARASLDDRDWEFEGTLLAGPTGAPTTLRIPVQFWYPFRVDAVNVALHPADADVDLGVQFSKHVATDTLTPTSVFITDPGDVVVPGTSVAYDHGSAVATVSSSGLAADTLYTLHVTTDVYALDGSAMDAEYTFPFSTIDLTPPGPVTGLTATPNDPNIDLSWVNPADPDFVKTLVLRSTEGFATDPSASASQALVYEGAAESATDTGVAPETLYYYTAFAFDDWGNASQPATDTAAIAAPTAVTLGLSATQVSGGQTIWATVITSRGLVPGPDPGAPVAIEFLPQGGATWSVVALGTTDLLSRAIIPLAPDGPGYFRAVRLADTFSLQSVSAPVGVSSRFGLTFWSDRTSVRRRGVVRFQVQLLPRSYASFRTVKFQRRIGRGKWRTVRWIGLNGQGYAHFSDHRHSRGTVQYRLIVPAYGGVGGATSNTIRVRWR